ncbi:hypothetical protein OYT1_ch0287 [Ferriphaselus amnicola]|uniref:TIR domain-containing protein n=1 Tax=Ferriphaselus amnicola TaxID=1188319 RepID=A0A2Z6G8S0_9PROT|nr:toll/interleukin-1 receptor domain-containing protein [Ferriphaselus amnicola]BBE49860.1 hypothetical protein OYT1_ch0287 [Ferriphaselus amnicola]
MSIKVFISYSHKDEQHKDSLDEHLAMLKRNCIIDAWHDRKIVASEKWAEEVSENLEQSELILFLISSSFLASDYCFSNEMKRAISMHEEGRAKLIPILVRPCDWSCSELSKFQAVPKDAKPITTWPNPDEAWLDVISGIKRQLDTFKPVAPKEIAVSDLDIHKISKATLEWIDDTEVVLTHRRVDKVLLGDVYISPDLESDDRDDTNKLKIVTSEVIINEPNKYLIFGEEQQGKTSLLKNAFKQLLKSEIYPVYLDAKEVNQSDILKSLAAALKHQYDNFELTQYLAMPNTALIVDDLDGVGLNPKYRANLLASINAKFSHVVMVSHSSLRYLTPEIEELDDYKKYELLGFGHLKRAALVERWISLGIEESIGETELYEQSDEIKSRLDNIIRRNIVPPKPIYILMLLQMFEAYTQHNLELSSHGYCYQQLIYQAFDHAKIQKKDVDKYLNVLTELAWALYRNGGTLNAHHLDIFFTEYEKTFLAVDGDTIIRKLKSNSILTEKEFKIQFKYPYLYYFFIAKKIADSYSTSSEVREEVRTLIANLHREDYANILVFVTHHTKEAWVLDEIQKALGLLFIDQSPATLSKEQLTFMDEFLSQIPELVMEQRVISEERMKHNKNLDDIERNGNEVDEKQLQSIDAVAFLANINKTFKGMEISGQIIRNRHASLTRNAIYDLANNGTLTGLRFLNFFIHISDTAKLEVIKYIEQKLKEHPGLTNERVQEQAKDIFLLMTYGVINGVIRKIASSIGSKEASEIYASIQKQNETPALVLLNQAIDLHFNGKLNIQLVAQTTEKLKNNVVCTRILKEMVIQHTYMFPVEYKEKQQLAELLGLSVQGQRLMDRNKLAKA